MKNANNSWKEKIDPAFDKPVKTYINFLRLIGNLPNDGQLSFDDDFKKLINKNINILECYDNKIKKEMAQFIENIGLTGKHEGMLLFKIINSIEYYNNFLKFMQKHNIIRNIFKFFVNVFINCLGIRIQFQMKALIKLTEKIPERESLQYYKEKFNHFIKELQKNPFYKIQNEYLLLTFALYIRIIFAKVEELDKTTEKEEKKETEYLNDPVVLNQIFGFFYSIMSQIAHQKTMNELIENIDDNNSLHKAVTIDKGLLQYKPIQERIRKAKISGDKRFFKELGRSIAKSPLQKVGLHSKTYAVLTFFINIELYKLTNEELHLFLEDCGLTPPAYPDGFNKFLQRHIRNKQIFTTT
ncbi:MAG: hypothetical protein E3K37_12425 [Candidatus Kuenenia sp.]|nr:hypothetical protein [Candidatus Kuenenia hertensis]